MTGAAAPYQGILSVVEPWRALRIAATALFLAHIVGACQSDAARSLPFCSAQPEPPSTTTTTPTSSPNPTALGGDTAVGTQLDLLTMGHPDIYLGAWWDATANAFVVAAADGQQHQDIVERYGPQAVQVVQAPYSRSYFQPNVAALLDPSVSELVTSFGVDPMSAQFRVTLNDVSSSSIERISRGVPVHRGVCIEPEPLDLTAG